jgi:TolB-like protein/Flp pilus assembly protein TadD
MSSAPGLIGELKRRKVVRVAVVYVATAFAVLQAADIMLPQMNVPEWAMGLLVAFVVLGFPIALVLGWALEVTPDGIRRTEAAPAHIEPGTTPALLGKRTLLVAGLLVVLGLGLSAGWLLKPGAPGPVEAAAVVEPGPATMPGGTDEERQPVALPAAERESIAVLPFVNMSPDPENAYFADGISEELLNVLAGIDGLKVASRTSAFSFKGSNTPIPEIARQLGVRHVLEGSVRKQGNQVRITAQLIEAGDDAHLWSERYDRDLDDIFQVQEEIARAITLALEDILGTRQVAVEAPTRDMEAYQSYLQGRSRFYQRSELDLAIDNLRNAVERDPDFAEAWALLAATYWLTGKSGYQTVHERSKMAQLAGPAADRAMALNSGIPIGLAVKGQIVIDSGNPGAVAEGIRLLERAVALPAPDTTPRLWLALLWLELGHAERALPLLETARRLDPLLGINSGVLGIAHAIEGRRAEAERLALEAVALSGLPFWGTIVVVDRVHDQDTAGATELVAAMQSRLGDAFEIDRREASALLKLMKEPSRRMAYLDSWSQERGHYFGENVSLMFERGDRAFEAAQTQVNRPWAILMSAWLPAMQWLREDPRYFQLMERRGRVEYWDSYGYPRGCRPVDDPAGRRLACSE